MRRTFLAFLVASIATGLAAAQADGDLVHEPSPKAPRGKRLEWKSPQGRPFLYRLPKDIDGKNPPDLLLMLHGTGLDHRWSFANYPILGDFRRRDIVVSPDGLTPGGGGTFNFVQGPKDGEQIAGLIADFKKRFPIGRVYLYGHSQGAFFCYWFAGEHPELVDGIVAHAGNVLDVKHDKLAKQKVAIGILHGRADAVVPVDCAIRTETIYREQGYAKVRLEIVDGLTEQSGHWPLPVQVASMLEWLDQVSTQSAAQAVRTAIGELQRELPDLGVVGDLLGRAKKLLPKADPADKAALPPAIDALQTFLDKTVLVHSQALLAGGAALDPNAAFGEWAPQFGIAERAFADHAEWKKAMAKTRETKSRHDKAVDKAIKALAKPSRESRAAAARCYEEAFLAARAEELREALRQALGAAGAAEAASLQQLVDRARERSDAQAAARKSMAARLQPLLEELRTTLADWFRQ